jgi:hypothetical protein
MAVLRRAYAICTTRTVRERNGICPCEQGDHRFRCEGVQTILTPGDEDDVDAIRRGRRNAGRTLAALQIDGYSNTFKSPGIVGINSVTVG